MASDTEHPACGVKEGLGCVGIHWGQPLLLLWINEARTGKGAGSVVRIQLQVLVPEGREILWDTWKFPPGGWHAYVVTMDMLPCS